MTEELSLANLRGELGRAGGMLRKENAPMQLIPDKGGPLP